jgi:hypothetical protein
LTDIFEYNYEADLAIDPYYLHEICCTHADVFNKWAKAHAQAKALRYDAKEAYDVAKANLKHEIEKIRADLDYDIRTNWQKYELKKITDTIVENWIIRHDDYQGVLKECRKQLHQAALDLNEAQKREDALEVAVKAFEQRKAMIEDDIDLYKQNYWAKPKEKGSIERRIQEVIESDINEEIADNLQKSKRFIRKEL